MDGDISVWQFWLSCIGWGGILGTSRGEEHYFAIVKAMLEHGAEPNVVVRHGGLARAQLKPLDVFDQHSSSLTNDLKEQIRPVLMAYGARSIAAPEQATEERTMAGLLEA